MMNMTSEIKLIIPAIDSVPLMGHPLLEKILLVFTFILHMIPMNIMLGAVILAIFLKSQKLLKYGDHERAYRLYRDIIKLLPTCLSLTITLPVAHHNIRRRAASIPAGALRPAVLYVDNSHGAVLAHDTRVYNVDLLYLLSARVDR